MHDYVRVEGHELPGLDTELVASKQDEARGSVGWQPAVFRANAFGSFCGVYVVKGCRLHERVYRIEEVPEEERPWYGPPSGPGATRGGRTTRSASATSPGSSAGRSTTGRSAPGGARGTRTWTSCSTRPRRTSAWRTTAARASWSSGPASPTAASTGGRADRDAPAGRSYPLNGLIDRRWDAHRGSWASNIRPAVGSRSASLCGERFVGRCAPTVSPILERFV